MHVTDHDEASELYLPTCVVFGDGCSRRAGVAQARDEGCDALVADRGDRDARRDMSLARRDTRTFSPCRARPIGVE